MYQISLIAAFIAGIVALFAPCCITYLLPAYFANIFKEKRRILLMTTVYSLGIFTVMLPIVLGAHALSALFFQLHDQTYIVGSLLMILISFFALLGLKLPMPRFKTKSQAIDIPSTYTLGIVSGIAASCCAPVLIGVITLSGLTSTLAQSLGVGISYVLGMVSPLYFASIFIQKGNILNKEIFQKQLGTLTVLGKRYAILTSNFIAFAIFSITGIIMLTLTLTGKLGMSNEKTAIQYIQNTAFAVTKATEAIPMKDFLFALIIGIIIYKILLLTKKEDK